MVWTNACKLTLTTFPFTLNSCLTGDVAAIRILTSLDSEASWTALSIVAGTVTVSLAVAKTVDPCVMIKTLRKKKTRYL